MKINNLVSETTALIRFSDCDPFNHLNNARYIDYFLNAREDHLRQLHGFDIYEFAKVTGLSWVVLKHDIEYVKPAFLMETVIMDSILLQLEEKEILVEMRMWNKDKTALKAFLWTTFVHFDLKQQRSVKHSEELLQKFQPFVLVTDQQFRFDQRLEEAKATARVKTP
jgi:thioesterase III